MHDPPRPHHPEVSEEDVIAAITDKSLKAKKMGNAYRISKGALEEFLKG
jgi:excisionase family DNA binding protein